MNYEKMWKELKNEFEDERYNGKIKDALLTIMNALENKYDERITCIKRYENYPILFEKGKKYVIIRKNKDYIYINDEFGSEIEFFHKKFKEYFKQ